MSLKIKKRAILATASVAVMGSAIVGQGSFAQEGDAVFLDEIVVTAQKRSQTVQEVPIAITAIGAEAMEKRGIDNLSQIADFAPNVTMDFTAPISGSSSTLVAYIRGIGQSDFAMNFEPGVGVYVDGVYIARNVGAVIDLLDLERIEILKGPQGTLFGRNTIGGAVSVVSKRPGDELSAKGEVTVGSFNRQDIRGSFNIPLSDAIKTSLAFSSKNRDGYVHRIPYPGILSADQANFRSIDQGKMDRLPSGNDLGNQNTDTIRGQLSWDVSEDVTLWLSADFTRSRENAAPAVLVDAETWMETGGIAGLYNACVSGAPIPVCASITDGLNGTAFDPQFTSRTPYDNRFLTDDDNTTYGNAVAGTYLDVWGISAELNWAISDTFELKSITGYRNLESAFGEDADGSPLIIDHHAFELIQDQFSQEFQLLGNMERLKWVAGLYYFQEDGNINDYVPLAAGLFQVYGPNDVHNKSYAAFGQFTYAITDAWSFTGGIRYTREEKEFIGRQRDLNDLSAQLGVPLAAFPVPTDTTILFPPGTNEQTYDDVSLRLGTEYRVSDDVFVYASYSEGFKSGGWDTRLTGPELEAPVFEPETARAYEIGVKSEWFDRRLRVNIAGFYTDYSNLQLIIQRGISPLTTNAGESEIKGMEVDFQWLITPEILITGTYGYTDAEYTDLDDRANLAGIFLDNEFNNTPRHSLSLGADYTYDLSSGGSLRFHADYSWRDDQYNDAVNTPELKQEAYSLMNASVKYQDASGNWNISAGVQNLTDKDYIMSGFNQPGVGFIYETLGRPREWWVKAGMEF